MAYYLIRALRAEVPAFHSEPRDLTFEGQLNFSQFASAPQEFFACHRSLSTVQSVLRTTLSPPAT
jgi:hypothetical protein